MTLSTLPAMDSAIAVCLDIIAAAVSGVCATTATGSSGGGASIGIVGGNAPCLASNAMVDGACATAGEVGRGAGEELWRVDSTNFMRSAIASFVTRGSLCSIRRSMRKDNSVMVKPIFFAFQFL